MDNTFIVDIGTCAVKHGSVRKARRGGGAAASGAGGAQQPTPHVVPNEGHESATGDALAVRSGTDVAVGSLAPQLAQLLAKSSCNANDYTLLLMVHPLASVRTKEFLVRSAFEELAARRVCVAYAPVAALLGVGCTTGVVVDMGYHATTVVPVWNGTPISHLVEAVVGQGSHAVDAAFAEALCRADDSFPSPAHLVQHHSAGFLHQLKLDCASLQPGLRASAATTPLVLPDGTSLKSPLSTEDCVACTQQALLRGTSLLYTTQQATRNMLRLHTNVPSSMIPWVLVGGAAAIPGVESYFLEGLGAAKGTMHLGKDLIHQPCRDPTTASWTGAAIMAQLSTFLGMCIDKETYDDCGPRESLRYNLCDAR